LTIDSIVYYSLYSTYPVRLFRILRPCMFLIIQFYLTFIMIFQEKRFNHL
jgi:hypothetical protein